MTKERFVIRFKKGAPYKGLDAVGSGTPSTEIFVNSISVGSIQHNDSHTDYLLNRPRAITVWLHLYKKDINEDGNPDCPWRTYVSRNVGKTEPEAREWVRKALLRPEIKSRLWLKQD